MHLIHPNAKNLIFDALDDKICSICHEEMVIGTCNILECTHAYHKECISKWLYDNDMCPTCRHISKCSDFNASFYDAIIENISSINIYYDDDQVSLLEYGVYTNNTDIVETILDTEFDTLEHIDKMLNYSIKNNYIEIFRLLMNYSHSIDYVEYDIKDNTIDYIIVNNNIEMLKVLIDFNHFMLCGHVSDLLELGNNELLFLYIKECISSNCYDDCENLSLCIVFIICNVREYYNDLLELLDYRRKENYAVWVELLTHHYIFNEVSDSNLLVVVIFVFENLPMLDYNTFYLRCVQERKYEAARFLQNRGCVIIIPNKDKKNEK